MTHHLSRMFPLLRIMVGILQKFPTLPITLPHLEFGHAAHKLQWLPDVTASFVSTYPTFGLTSSFIFTCRYGRPPSFTISQWPRPTTICRFRCMPQMPSKNLLTLFTLALSEKTGPRNYNSLLPHVDNCHPTHHLSPRMRQDACVITSLADGLVHRAYHSDHVEKHNDSQLVVHLKILVYGTTILHTFFEFIVVHVTCS